MPELGARIQKIIDDNAKLPFEKIEGAGKRFMTISPEEFKKRIRDECHARGSVHVPPTRLSDEERERNRVQQDLRTAEKGLSYLNDPAHGAANYEFVKPVAGCFFLSLPGPRGVYHCNFEAKLKNDPESEAQLFFLEIVKKSLDEEKVSHCRSLGLSGSKAAATGLNGCKVCKRINHPKNVRFVTT